MREIKFRAYVKFLNKIQNVVELYNSGGCMTDEYEYTLDHDDIHLMQFVGLTDKNGVDIYFDDVVYIAGYGNLLVSTIGDLVILVDALAENDIGEVLGNIHENKDLLGE